MEEWARGLPEAARERMARQRASAVAGSLLSAAGAASIRSAGLAPVGEVFGCTVMNLGWSGAGCGWRSPQGGWPAGGATGAAGGYAGTRAPGARPNLLTGAPAAVSPVRTSGDGGRYSSFAPYVRAYEAGWNGALARMLAEARALGADGVVGVRIERSRLAGSTWEYTALGTAVRSTDPVLAPRPQTPRSQTPRSQAPGEVWHANLSAEDCAAAILSGFLPREIVLGISVATKHEDWQLRQQRTSWVNGEVSGMSELLQAARSEARSRLGMHATAGRGGPRNGDAQLVLTGMTLTEFDTPCSAQEGRDLHAESMLTGTTLVPVPRFTKTAAAGSAQLTVLPLGRNTR